MNIEHEQDVERLRKAAQLLENENKKLIKRTIDLEREVLALKGMSPSELQYRLKLLESQLQQRNKALFGDKTEKRRSESSAKDADAKTKERQTGHGPREQTSLPREEQVHTLDEADKTCPGCGECLPEWPGQFETSDEIDVIERHFVIRHHKRQKYKCGCGHIETALGADKLQPGGRYSINFGVGVAFEKYWYHSPLERQARKMLMEDLQVDSQTLWDQIARVAQLLAPVYDNLRAYILKKDVIGVDETHWRMLSAKGKDEGINKRWQVWATCSSDAVAYSIRDSRGAKAAKDVLGDYAGVIMCDGYAVYESLSAENSKLRIAHCLAHVRRKFLEARDDFPTQADEALEIIGALYGVEAEAQTGPPETLLHRREKLRAEKSKPAMLKLQQWAYAQKVLPQSSIGRAISYMGEVWDGLQVFLNDPAVDIDNNATERALRGIVLGRKNHYGSKSQRGTEVAALFYTLIESCKLNDVDPRRYLETMTRRAVRGETLLMPHEFAAETAA